MWATAILREQQDFSYFKLLSNRFHTLIPNLISAYAEIYTKKLPLKVRKYKGFRLLYIYKAHYSFSILFRRTPDSLDFL